MRMRAGHWLLLLGFGGAGCTPSQPRQSPAPARRSDGATAAPATPAAPRNLPDSGSSCVPRGAENTPEACNNHIDDDCDQQVDCADYGCASAPNCRTGDAAPPHFPDCVRHGPESTLEACTNHLDDDCDGQIDCADYACRSVPGVNCGDAGSTPPGMCVRQGPENTAEACSNRSDDDCDGQVDCADSDCPREACAAQDAGAAPTRPTAATPRATPTATATPTPTARPAARP